MRKINTSEWATKMRHLLSHHKSQISLITQPPKENTMENNAVTSELVEANSNVAKVTFDQPINSPELKDFSEFVRAEEEVEEPAIPVTSIKGRTASLLAAAAGAMSASAGGAALWDTLTKIGMGGSMKVVKSKNWGGVLSPERKAAIIENNAAISQNTFNKDRVERKRQKKEAATVLGCKPTKAQKKQLRKARTEGRLTADVTQYSAGVNAFAEQLVAAAAVSQIPTAITLDEVPQQTELLDTVGESQFIQTDLVDIRTNISDVGGVDDKHTQTNHKSEEADKLSVLGVDHDGYVDKGYSWSTEIKVGAIPEELVDVARTNIGDVVTALEVGATTPEKVLRINDGSVSISSQVADVDVARSYPSYKSEESTSSEAFSPSCDGDN